MKNFLKSYLTLEQPYGEIWLVIAGSVASFTLGLLQGKESLEWVITAFFLLLIFSIISLFVTLWQRKKTGIFWYLYTLVFYSTLFFGLYEFVGQISNSEATPFLVISLVSGVFSVIFMTMILQGLNFFTIRFWKIFFVIETLMIIPLTILESLMVSELFNAIDFEMTKNEFIVSTIVFLILHLPYLYELYKHSFGKSK